MIYSFLASNILREKCNLLVTAIHSFLSLVLQVTNNERQITPGNSEFFLLRWHHTVCRMVDKQDQQQNIS
jgi:hypothetical protein